MPRKLLTDSQLHKIFNKSKEKDDDSESEESYTEEEYLEEMTEEDDDMDGEGEKQEAITKEQAGDEEKQGAITTKLEREEDEGNEEQTAIDYADVEYLETLSDDNCCYVKDEKPDDWEDVDDDDDEDELVFVSKSGFVWNGKPRARTKTSNKVVYEPALRNGAERITSIKQAFDLFITEDTVSSICSCTNAHRPSNKRGEKSSPVTANEVYAFIGILVASARHRGGQACISDLWQSDVLFRQHFYPAAMSRNRFLYIFDTIKFDDDAHRSKRNVLAPVRTVLTRFAAQCHKYYKPGTHVTVDERVVKVKHHAPFDQNGIKFWFAVDSSASSPYVLNLKIEDSERNPNDVVKELLRPYYNTHRGVTLGSKLTSVQLAKDLLEKDLMVTGTVRSTLPEIPASFVDSMDREESSTIFGFHRGLSLCCYAPKKDLAMAVLSAEFLDRRLDPSDNSKKLPLSVAHYFRTKRAASAVREELAAHSCARPTRRWPLRIFMELLDVAALNAYGVWTKLRPEWRANDRNRKRAFLRELAVQLVRDNIRDRRVDGVLYLHKSQLESLATYDAALSERGAPTVTQEILRSSSASNVVDDSTRSRCSFCPGTVANNRKTRYRCGVCAAAACPQHRREIVECAACKSLGADAKRPKFGSRADASRRCKFCVSYKLSDNNKTKRACSFCGLPACNNHRSAIVLCPDCDKPDDGGPPAADAAIRDVKRLRRKRRLLDL